MNYIYICIYKSNMRKKKGKGQASSTRYPRHVNKDEEWRDGHAP